MTFLTACNDPGLSLASVEEEKVEEAPAYEAYRPGEYDSADTAIVTKVSTITESITFYNVELAKSYTLSFDQITKYSDKYGTAMSVDQIKQGTLVDILFLKSKKLLVDLKENSEAFNIPEVTEFSVDAGTKVFRYKEDSYKIRKGTIILSKNEKLDLKDLSPIDEVTITGIDTSIYAITVNVGHGKLKLKHEDELVDGFIEFNSDFIEKIKKGMELTIPEGKYELTISKGKTTVTKSLVIERDEEAVLDLEDIVLEENKTGKVLFEVTPKDAEIYIDGKLIDSNDLQELGFGMHKLNAMCSGYEDLQRYFSVGEESATLKVILDEQKTKDSKTEEAEESRTDGAYIFVTASSPSGVEVFFDGNYIGMSPVSIPKSAGQHVIMLSKSGYITRSYNVNVENTDKDVYYTFDSLAPEQKINESAASTSSTQSSAKEDSGTNP